MVRFSYPFIIFMKIYPKSQQGFSLIEVVVGSALFLIVAMAAYGAYVGLFQTAYLNQTKIIALGLADEQLEMIRGMPYNEVGLLGGNPRGRLIGTQNLTRGNISFTVVLDISDVSLQPPLFSGGKLVQVDVSCQTCKNFTPVTLVGEVFPSMI